MVVLTKYANRPSCLLLLKCPPIMSYDDFRFVVSHTSVSVCGYVRIVQNRACRNRKCLYGYFIGLICRNHRDFFIVVFLISNHRKLNYRSIISECAIGKFVTHTSFKKKKHIRKKIIFSSWRTYILTPVANNRS